MARLVSQVRRERLFSQAGLDLQHPQELALRSDPQPQGSHLPLTTPAGCDYDHNHHCQGWSNPLDPRRLTPKWPLGRESRPVWPKNDSWAAPLTLISGDVSME